MKLSDAKKDLERKGAALAELIEERSKLLQATESLKSERCAALMRSSAEDAEKAVSPFGKKLEEIAPKLERYELWVNKQKEELQKAKDVLRQAEEDQKTRLAQSIEQKENEHFDKARQSIPSLMEGIQSAYMEVCSGIAEFGAMGQRIFPDGSVRTDGAFERGLESLPQKLFELSERHNLKRTLLRGYGPPLEVFGLFKPDSEGVPSGPGIVDPGPVARIRHQRRVELWTKEFLEKEK
jgi:hypothetical protein